MSFSELFSLFKSIDVAGNDPQEIASLYARMAANKAATDEIWVAAFHAAFDELGIANPFTHSQLVDYLRWAQSRNQVSKVFSNFESEYVGEKEIKKPLTMRRILEQWQELTGSWPRVMDGVPFVHDEHGLSRFDNQRTARVMGYIRSKVDQVKWNHGGNFVSEAEFVAELERTAQNYSTIELLPHEPPIEGIYYASKAPEPGDGSHLERLLDFYNPATEIDRQLIKAKLLTDFWGGPPGTRPVFVFTSDDGRGVGKTKAAETTGDVAGGVLSLSASDSMSEIKKRLLSPQGQTKRNAVIDNLKTLRFSWDELEALVTAQTISGHRMYTGEGQRPNTLTYVITLNGVNLSEDMAQRCVVIKLVRGEYSGTWYEDITRYINQHRQEIIADIIAALRAEPTPLEQFSRWATWEEHVLSRIDKPELAQQLILERQGEANCDREEANLIEEFFSEKLTSYGHDPVTARILIPVRTITDWFNAAMNEHFSTTKVTRRLKQMANERQIRRLSYARHGNGRGFIWDGPETDVSDRITNFEQIDEFAA